MATGCSVRLSLYVGVHADARVAVRRGRLAGAGTGKRGVAHGRASTVVATRRCAGRTRRLGRRECRIRGRLVLGVGHRTQRRISGRVRRPFHSLVGIQSEKDCGTQLPQGERRLQSISMTGSEDRFRRLRVVPRLSDKAVRGNERCSGEHAQWQSSKPVPAVIRAKIVRS